MDPTYASDCELMSIAACDWWTTALAAATSYYECTSRSNARLLSANVGYAQSYLLFALVDGELDEKWWRGGTERETCAEEDGEKSNQLPQLVGISCIQAIQRRSECFISRRSQPQRHHSSVLILLLFVLAPERCCCCCFCWSRVINKHRLTKYQQRYRTRWKYLPPSMTSSLSRKRPACQIGHAVSFSSS